ncbi:MAG: hypothetical protein RBU37_02955 [Myxococcota bacterium]|nr:hypothetical protein [Myxococcota bacterium]
MFSRCLPCRATEHAWGTGQAPNGQKVGGRGQAPNGQKVGGRGQAPNGQKIR